MPGQSVLVQSSIIYCMIHMYVLLLLFYEYRCSKRTFILSALTVIFVTSAICLWILFTQGIAAMGQYGVMIASVPTLLFFFAMSKHRNFQFIFAFCLSDTVHPWKNWLPPRQKAIAAVLFWMRFWSMRRCRRSS